MNKGTGIVTSVPSDSPDDYINLLMFKKDKKTQKKNNEKIKLHNVMQKVDEEEY